MLFICKILCFPILGGKNFFAPGKGGGGGRGWGLATPPPPCPDFLYGPNLLWQSKFELEVLWKKCSEKFTKNPWKNRKLISCLSNGAGCKPATLLNMNSFTDILEKFKTSLPEIFCKKGVLRTFAGLSLQLH